MNFDLHEDQRLLKESVERLLADTYDFDTRRRCLAAPDGWSREQWQRFADMGLLALPFAEVDGGIGGGPVETLIVMEALGNALSLEPYFASVVLAGGLLRLGGSAAQRSSLIPAMGDGSLVMAFAQAEARSRYDLHDLTTTAQREGDRWRLNGEKRHVIYGASADKLIVSARTSGDRRDRHGIGLFIVDADTPGVSRRGYLTQDRQRAAQITFAGVETGADSVIGDPGAALPLLEQVVDMAIAALCAEAVGAMTKAFELTLDYLKVREQFGVKIGSFQALQHRAVDMLVRIEEARSMAIFAAMMCTDPDPVERRKAMSMAKVQAGRSGKFVGEQAIQLHGGIGMTDEHPVGHCYRRLTMIDLMFGSSEHHLASLSRSA